MQHTLETLCNKQKKMGFNWIINRQLDMVCVDLLTLSEKEPRTIGIRVLVRHLMDQFRQSRRSTEELDQKNKIL
jgi:hypothetical protein